MNDIEDIRRVIAEYCFATDNGNTERWVSLFAEDIQWEGGAFGRFSSKDEARAYHSGAGDAATHFRHFTTNSVIEVAGGTARAHSYVQVWDQSSAVPVIMFSGIYEDEFVKQDDRWLFKIRRLHPHPSAIGSK